MTAQIPGRPVVVTEPGLYAGIPDAVYHADPVPAGSLSVSGAKVLARNPARYDWDRRHPRDWEPTFNHGHAAHALVLGVGPRIVELNASDWRSPKTRAIRDEQLAAGRIPLLSKDAEQVRAMRAALLEHPLAARLLGYPDDRLGAEVSAFRIDDETGGWLRARFDVLRADGLVDYKTAESADPDVFRRKAIDYGYHQQAAWYLDMAEALGCDVAGGFRFVVQEKDPPFLVSVVEFDPDTVQLGRDWNRYAIDAWLECRTTDTWPGYPADTVTITAPPWAPRPPTTTEASTYDDDAAGTPAGDVYAYLDALTEGNEES